MNFFKKNTTPRAKYPLSKAEPTHKRFGFVDKCKQFWLNNHDGIVLLTIAVCIGILIFTMGYAAASGHFRMFSSEANVYEHLSQVI